MVERTAPGEMQDWLIEECARRFRQVLESMAGVEPEVRWVRGLPAGVEVSDWWEQPLSLAADAAIWLGAPKESWQAVGDLALRAAGIEDSPEEDLRSTFLEVVSQALSAAAQTLGGQLGREVTCERGKPGEAPAAGLPSYALEISFPGTDPPRPVAVVLSEGLAAKLSPEGAGAASPLPSAGVAAAGAAGAAPEPAPRTLDLLLDVELPVSVSFGRAQLRLKDVLKLTTGSIVELNRSVAEPVEVIVNNCVIARGEVVVLEGNYGVRINQILSRQERLRTLY